MKIGLNEVSAAWLSAVAAACSALAGYGAYLAAYAQRDAQFSSVLYGKQIELTAAANSSMHKHVELVNYARLPGHPVSELIASRQSVEVYETDLTQLFYVMPDDAGTHITDVLQLSNNLLTMLRNAEANEQSFRNDVSQRNALVTQEAKIVFAFDKFARCAADRFRIGHYVVSGDMPKCYSPSSKI